MAKIKIKLKNGGVESVYEADSLEIIQPETKTEKFPIVQAIEAKKAIFGCNFLYINISPEMREHILKGSNWLWIGEGGGVVDSGPCYFNMPEEKRKCFAFMSYQSFGEFEAAQPVVAAESQR